MLPVHVLGSTGLSIHCSLTPPMGAQSCLPRPRRSWGKQTQEQAPSDVAVPHPEDAEGTQKGGGTGEGPTGAVKSVP